MKKNATNATKSAQKEAIISSVEQGATLQAAAHGAKIDRVTIWRWRNKDTEFNSAIIAAERSRIEVVKDVAYSNALKSEFDPRYQTSLLAWMNNEGGWVNPNRTEIAGQIDVTELAKILEKMNVEL